MEEKIKRLKRWLGGKAGPFLIEIWPTNRCNLRCIMCGTWAHRRRLEKEGVKYYPTEEIKNEVSEKRLLTLVTEAKKLGTREFLITGGGESFLRKGTTLRLMKEIKDKEMFGNLNTNGTLLTEKDIREIVEIGWDTIMFSIDAPNTTHDSIRGMEGCFEKVKRNLFVFQKVKRDLKSDKPKIVFNTVLNNRIYDKIDKIIEFASQVDCESITLIPLIPYDEIARKIELNDHQKLKLQENLEKLINISKKLRVSTNLNELNFSISGEEMDDIILKEMGNSPKDLVHAPCFEPLLHFLVKGDGEATFCCMIENSPENVKEKSLEQIWFGEYFNQQRRNFIDKTIRKECKFCVFSQFIKNKKIRTKLQKFK